MMRAFDTFVVRTDLVTDISSVRNHPNVQHLIELPEDWLLYEFHHPLFEDPDFLGEKWYQKMERFPGLKQARMEMLQEERALRRPWYERKGTKFGDSSHAVGTQLTQYHICTLSKMLQVRMKLELGWGCTSEVALRFQNSESDLNCDALDGLIKELVVAGRTYGLVCLENDIGDKSLTVRLRSEVVSSHWIVALWVLTMDARLKIGVDEIVYLKKTERG